MCGIVGVYLKNPELRPRLGEIFSPMLMEMSERGPDSSGVAVYREDDAAAGKVVVHDPGAGFGCDALAERGGSGAWRRGRRRAGRLARGPALGGGGGGIARMGRAQLPGSAHHQLRRGA